MKKAAQMIPLRRFTVPLSTLFFICSFLSVATCNQISEDSSIYDILNLYGLPMGLFPKGVSNFRFDNSGKFQVYLDQACNAKFENELHYEMNVSGVLSYGQIDGLSGMTAQDLFLWFPVIEIRVDIPSSGLIYFDVGVVSKKFSLSSFETPRDCLAVAISDLQNERNTLQTVSKELLDVFVIRFYPRPSLITGMLSGLSYRFCTRGRVMHNCSIMLWIIILVCYRLSEDLV